MRVPPSVSGRLAPVALLFFCTVSFACDRLPSGQTLWVRLSAPVSSYSSKAGDPVTTILTEDAVCEDGVVFPVGTRIEGVVRSVRKVGWGIRHETAALTLSFTSAQVGEDPPVPIAAAVADVENAREQVSKGVVQGIRSSNSPQGTITSRLKYLPALNPYPDLGLLIFKATFPIFPEPEIYFPAGTDLRLKLLYPVTAPSIAVSADRKQIDPAEEFELARFTRTLPQRSTTPQLVDADIVNLVFIGSRQQIESAFVAAGWDSSDVFNKRSFTRNFYAYLNNSAYAQAPMRSFLLNGKTADMNWQNSLNSYAKRDHLRIWRWSETEPSDSETVWLSSSTHDTGASLSLKYRHFVHHISPDIDDERSKVIRDLELAGCVKQVNLVSRPGFANITQNATGDPVRTDGALAIVELKSCEPVVPGLPTATEQGFKAGNKVFRYFRRSILTFRSDIWRANIIYGAYDLSRMGVDALRQHRSAETLTNQPLGSGDDTAALVKTFK